MFLVRNKHTHINLIRHLFKKKEYTLNYQWNKVAQFKFRFSLDGGEYGRTNKLIFVQLRLNLKNLEALVGPDLFKNIF